MKRAIQLAGTTIAIDTRTENVIKEELPERNIIYLPNPYPYQKNERSRENVKREIIFIGWVIKTKGIEELLTAWKSLYKKYPEWSLRVIGPYDQIYLNALKERFSFQGVVFNGELEHSAAMGLLAEARIFVLPSYTEGFPNAILEAMAYKKAIIASDVGAISDMLSGSCGLVIPPQNPIALEAALEKLITNGELTDALSENAFLKLQNEYTLDKIFPKYMALWKGEGAE